MKKVALFLALIVAGCVISPASYAEEGHGHESEHAGEHAGGPKGGRLLENVEPHAEFFVEKDKTATITFYNDAMNPIAAADQSASITLDTNGNKTRLEFEKKGDVLVTIGTLPQGESHSVVLQLKQTADTKPSNFRFTIDDKTCDECKRAEYACICGAH